MRTHLFFKSILSLSICLLIFSCKKNSTLKQTVLSLQPNASTSKEATISSVIPDENRSSKIFDIGGVAWTSGGNTNLTRTLLDFDLNSIPSGVKIDSAKLFLFGNPNNTIGANVAPNNLELYRITSNWNQNTVTWRNQPTFDLSNKVSLSSSIGKDYSDTQINITPLIQSYLDNKNQSFGFMIKLSNEVPYRLRIFASSKVSNSTLHPKLEIYYKK